jgi:hypothetical protein
MGLGAALREELLRIEPAGDGGFEGLLAETLAAFSGLTFRLAKSGSQFGRDGSSTAAPFAIALEAKRYDSDLRLEELAGKVVVAGSELEGRIDVWALGATSNVGDGTLAKLTGILEQHGIALLPLDWAARPLPPMAVLLSEVKDVTLAWFRHHHPKVDIGKLASQLDEIAAHRSFKEQVAQLREAVNRNSVGLDALRRNAARWLRRRFTDRRMSQSVFGQYIAVADGASLPQPRLAEAKMLGELVAPDPNDIPIVAVLGGEGVGKTWLVAQWWLSLPESPIMLLVTGRRAECLIPGKPMESLARLIADQAGDSETVSIQGWCRRLERWKSQVAESHLRFIIVLDGINEHAARPWADLIKELAREAQALGGLVIVTCRDGFWRRDVQPRLRDCLPVRELPVGGYCDSDLTAVLARHNIDPADVSAKVREFLRNPRICSVAVSLISRLSLQPSELTIERLLMEYWQSRLSERGNRLTHNARDLENSSARTQRLGASSRSAGSIGTSGRPTRVRLAATPWTKYRTISPKLKKAVFSKWRMTIAEPTSFVARSYRTPWVFSSMQNLGRSWEKVVIPASISEELSIRYEGSISWRTSSRPQWGWPAWTTPSQPTGAPR